MPASKPRVLCAMSGGVDSSVAAAMLLRQGFEVVGVFMRLGSPGESLDSLEAFDSAGVACDPSKIKIGHQGCCSINDAADARLVAAELSIPFYVVNFKKDFGRIIDYFVDEYATGRTPNPCVRCNDWLKFGRLHGYSGQIGAEFVASGHYARIETESAVASGDERRAMSGARLLRGVDHSKDQSYVLFGLPRAQLSTTLLPIGGLEKPRVRELAQQWGLPTFDKPDSQEICFVPDNDYAGLVERRRPGLVGEGAVINELGERVGTHAGQHRLTIGQRKGIGVALGHPIFVVSKDAANNTVTVGKRSQLLASRCDVSEANWLVDRVEVGAERRVLARYRYNSQAVPATVLGAADANPMQASDSLAGAACPSGRPGRFSVVFDEPQEAVTPGQALVLYDANEPDWVLGGGWIDQVEALRPVTPSS